MVDKRPRKHVGRSVFTDQARCNAKDGAHSGNQTWQGKTLLAHVFTLFYKGASTKFYRLFSDEKKGFLMAQILRLPPSRFTSPGCCGRILKKHEKCTGLSGGSGITRPENGARLSIYIYNIYIIMYHYVSLCITIHH